MQEMSNILIEAVTEALETMAFMMVMPPEDELATPYESVLVQMKFTGPSCGTVELAAGGEIMTMIAANALGVDPEDPEADAKGVDAFKEILNTTCGVLIPMLANTPEDVFDVTVPSAKTLAGEAQWEQYVDQDDVVILDVDGFPMAARLLMEVPNETA